MIDRANPSSPRIVIIGAGIGGLTTAALLARAGLPVTVLEAHIYPGGCAGTFYHQGYRFDAGATLAAGFYPGGPMDLVAQAVGIAVWPIPAQPAQADEPVMAVHLANGQVVSRWADERRWAEQARAFGRQATTFWQWQERTADALWQLALRSPPWLPQTPSEIAQLIGTGLHWLGSKPRQHMQPSLLADALRPVAAHLQSQSPQLRQFVDAQLLIAAQATSATANALYGASALDLPRRGVVHLAGGMGAIAATLAQAVRDNGGAVHYRQEVTHIVCERGQPVAVETKRGQHFPAEVVIANLPPWNIARLLGEAAPPALRNLPAQPVDGWGAFMLYVGLDGAALPPHTPLHQQVVMREPLGEGNTAFLSLSPAWDHGRAPAGKRALTLSTHTRLAPWWRLHSRDKGQYEARKADYQERLLLAAERALPGLRAAAELIMPGTPITFQRFTRRVGGWVGGFPQTNLFRAWGPRLLPNVWMVGDSIFPGQSTTAVALGGWRLAKAVLAQVGAQVAIASQQQPLQA